MYNEFNQHKKSDAIKWAVVFILIDCGAFCGYDCGSCDGFARQRKHA